jgi:hypothetical protein
MASLRATTSYPAVLAAHLLLPLGDGRNGAVEQQRRRRQHAH